MDGVRLVEENAVYLDLSIDQPQMVSRNSHHPLYEMLAGMHGIVEHNDIAPMHGAVGQNTSVPTSPP